MSNYEPFGEAGTMLPPSPEMMESLQYEPTEVTVCEDGCTAHDHDDGSGDYATYAEQDANAPASVNEDDELPPYSIFSRYWQTDKPLKYPRIPKCGHKFRAEFEPNHRNCESCWFTYFQVHGELTKAVEEAYQTGGAELIKKLRGPKFLDNFLKFMSTVALIKRQQEEAVKIAAKETDESITGFGNSVPIGENGSEGFATLDSAETAQS